MKKLFLIMLCNLSCIAMNNFSNTVSVAGDEMFLFYADLHQALQTGCIKCWLRGIFCNKQVDTIFCEHVAAKIDYIVHEHWPEQGDNFSTEIKKVKEVSYRGKSYSCTSDHVKTVLAKVRGIALQGMAVEFEKNGDPYKTGLFRRIPLSLHDQALLEEAIFPIIGKRYSCKLREIIDRDATKDEIQD